jgi:hypothetical protein
VFFRSSDHRFVIAIASALLLASGGCSESAPEKPPTAGSLLPDHRPAPPAAEYVDGTIPEGSTIRLTMTDPLGSATSHKGDLFRATLNQPVVAGGLTVLPAGSVFQGIVDRATPAKEGGPRGGGSLTLVFKVVYTPTGSSASVVAKLSEVGASAAAVVEGRRGKEAVLAAGTPIAIVLREALTLKVRKK